MICNLHTLLVRLYKMAPARRVASMENTRNACKISMGHPAVKCLYGYLNAHGNIKLRSIFKNCRNRPYTRFNRLVRCDSAGLLFAGQQTMHFRKDIWRACKQDSTLYSKFITARGRHRNRLYYHCLHEDISCKLHMQYLDTVRNIVR